MTEMMASGGAKGKYKFATTKRNYEDYSSGRVFYGSPGATGFPVRLASEIFQRCAQRLIAKGLAPPYTLYDPCCGGGYSPSVIGYLHGSQIQSIYCSDISAQALELAQRNLALLSLAGLDERTNEIRSLIEQYNKQSHRDALESSSRLKHQLATHSFPIQTKSFRFDILGNENLAGKIDKVDLVLTDLPYGQVVSWYGATDDDAPEQKLLTHIRPVLKPTSLVAITTSKNQPFSHEGYRRLEHTQIGKRRLLIMEPQGFE
jgi:23S rRNA (guanine2535-N1)-methyltransferase